MSQSYNYTNYYYYILFLLTVGTTWWLFATVHLSLFCLNAVDSYSAKGEQYKSDSRHFFAKLLTVFE